MAAAAVSPCNGGIVTSSDHVSVDAHLYFPSLHCYCMLGKLQSPLLGIALQNRLFAGLCHCNDTHGHLLFIQVCSDPTPMHCNTGQGKLYSPVLSVVLQNRHKAGLCHCNDTYGDMLFIQVCAVTQHSCTAALVKANALQEVAVKAAHAAGRTH